MKHETEASALLVEELSRFRLMTYEQLRDLIGSPQTTERVGPSGTTYQLEVEVFWDDRKGGNLRVMCAIDDGGFSAFHPKADDFMLAPDGRFVGE